LGAIFVIYRLQSLDSGFQNAFLAAGASNNSGLVNEILRLKHEDFFPSKASTLIGFQGSIREPHMRTVAYTDKWKKEIIRHSIPAFLSLTTHMSISAIIFLGIPRFSIANLDTFRLIAIADVSTFILLVFFITWTVIRMLSDDPIAERVYFPDIERPLPSTFPILLSYNEGRTTPSMFKFHIHNQTVYVLLYFRANNKFALSILTLNPTIGKSLVQKSYDERTMDELSNVWQSFISNPESILVVKESG
jgi:hypothetical protein